MKEKKIFLMFILYFITAKWGDIDFVCSKYRNPLTSWLPCLAKAAMMFQVEHQVASSSPSVLPPNESKILHTLTATKPNSSIPNKAANFVTGKPVYR